VLGYDIAPGGGRQEGWRSSKHLQQKRVPFPKYKAALDKVAALEAALGQGKRRQQERGP